MDAVHQFTNSPVTIFTLSPRYQFGSFVLSPAHRVLIRDGAEVPLIPRYFDLLVLLVSERHRAVSKQDIFDNVWKDVIVSDGALSQAIRTIRRALGDDPREPKFVRTVARHGYQFIHVSVIEGDDGEKLIQDRRPELVEGQARATLRERLLRSDASDEERREAAEELHALGTAEALKEIDSLPGHAEARAILRDTRWNVAGAGEVPLIGAEGGFGAIVALVKLRLRRAARIASSRWAAASMGGAAAGVIAGFMGGIAFLLVPESQARPAIILALGIVGGVAGAMGAAGVGAGLAAAEALARSQRTLALAICGGIGGAVIGGLAKGLAHAIVSGMFSRDLPVIAGAFEGLVLGGAAGLGYALSTASLDSGGMAAPRGLARARTALITGICCSAAAVLLTFGGWLLVGTSLDAVAAAFENSTVGLAPIARLLGEGTLRPMTGTLISAFEGLMFGAGLAFGLTHRPRRA
jgi:DNA-binding winged helix-turn-helix (wHTH) protein